MRVMFEANLNSFMFYQSGRDFDRPALMRELRERMVEDEFMHRHQARIFNIDSLLEFGEVAEDGSRPVNRMSNMVQVIFADKAGAAAFKLCYVGGDRYLPWADGDS